MMVLHRINVLGVGVSLVDMEQAIDQIEEWVRTRSKNYVCAGTVHLVMECQRSEHLKNVFNRAGMVIPDGMPLVWLARKHESRVTRVYGPDLLLAEVRKSRETRHRHFFYGGGPGITTRLVTRLQEICPNLIVAGIMEPPYAGLSELATPETAATINASDPDIVWVGIGSPKQELWMSSMRSQLTAPVLIGVGAAFDFHSGIIPQAPRWMQRSGLEWVFRLATDPRRLWRRYLINNPLFIWSIAMQKWGFRRYEL